MALMGRTRAVANKFVSDIDKIVFWTAIVVQVLFLFLYGYSIYTNMDKLPFLITYSLLSGLAIFNFIYMIVSHPYRKEDNVKNIKKFVRFFRYFINASMLGVKIFELIKFDATDFNKILIIISGVSLLSQIILEFIRMFTDYYMELFMTSVQMDLGFVIKMSKIGETKGNFFEVIDMPLEAIANKIDGKEPEYTETEKYLNELAKKYTDDIKQKHKEDSEANAEHQKQQIKEHLSTIKNFIFKKKNDEE